MGNFGFWEFLILAVLLALVIRVLLGVIVRVVRWVVRSGQQPGALQSREEVAELVREEVQRLERLRE